MITQFKLYESNIIGVKRGDNVILNYDVKGFQMAHIQ